MVAETWFVLAGVFVLFLGLVLAFSLVGGLTRERVSATGRSLEAIEALTTAPRALQEQTTPPFSDRVVQPVFNGLAGVGRRLTPANQRDKIRLRLDQAGNPIGWDVERIVAFKVLAAILIGLLAIVVTLLLGYGVALAVGLLVVGAILGFFLPNLLLKGLVDTRSEQIQRDLPNALDLLTISVESGLSFDAALSQVARNTEGPLAEEFTRVLQEMQIGLGRTAAIRAMGERSAVPDLQSFASAMVQADEFGIPIAEVLRVQSKEMRVKRRQRAEERAMKLPVKILFPLIFCVMPGIFIVILGPGIILIRDSLLF
jgi:tight adherence protein C